MNRRNHSLAAEKLLIIGAGGHGRVLADLIRCQEGHVLGFIDEDPALAGVACDPGGARCLLSQDRFLAELSGASGLPFGATGLGLGIGQNLQRLELMHAARGVRLPVIAHPAAAISEYAAIGPGSVLVAGCVVNTGARIGSAVIVNTGATVGHDCHIEDGVHVAPGANLCGGVRVGSGSWIGSGAVIIPGVTVGARVTIGAGAIVLQDVPDGATLAGNPARPISRTD